MERILRPRFTLADLERANDEWGANCGPGALAAICGLTLDEVRPHFGPSWPGYTNPTKMKSALAGIGRPFSWDSTDTSEQPMRWPRWGLCRVQWHGPWMEPGVPIRARYRKTHWIGCGQDRNEERGVFDVNCMSNGSGWVSYEDWAQHVAPVLAKDHDKRATGGWSLTHVIEVTIPGTA